MKKIKNIIILLCLIFAAANASAQNGSSWSQVGTIDTNYNVQNLKAIGNELYAGLSYATDSVRIGRWNGLFWTYYPGLRVLPSSKGISFDIYRDTLYVAYNNYSIGNTLSVNKLSNSTWIDVPLNNLVVTDTAFGSIKNASLKTVDTALYLFGNLVDFTNKKVSILKYGKEAWTVLGPLSNPGLNGEIGDISWYKNQLMIHGFSNYPYYYNLLTANSNNLKSTNILWDGTNWLKHNNYIDSVGILDYDSDTLFIQRGELFFRYYSPAFTNIGGYFSIPSVCSTFVAIKGSYYVFGDLKFTGGLISSHSLAELHIPYWWDMEENTDRGHMMRFQSHLYSPIINTHKQVEMLNPGWGLIKGNIYKDLNNNCIRDGADDNLNISRKVTVMPDSIVTIADFYGDYSILVAPGIKTISNSNFITNKYLLTAPCSSNFKTVTVYADSVAVVDFPMIDSANVLDLAVKIIPQGGHLIRKQQDDIVNVSVNNTGTVDISSGTLKLKLDNKLSIISSTPSYASYTNNIVTWNFTNLQKEGNKNFSLQVQLSSAAALYDSIQYKAWVTPNPDADTTDNADSIFCRIIYSYDPNDKQCFPPNIVLPNTDKLEYTVRFQNTGTSYAQNVYVVDTLDTNLPMDKIEITGWSTPSRPRIEVRNNNVLVFTFPNILLPDSNTNEKASHGYINYKCGLYKNLPLGTKITNRAYIYFDYNTPVPTKKTENTKANKTGISTRGKTDLNSVVSLYPNPAGGELFIQSLTLEMNTISILDIEGKVVFTSEIKGIKEILVNTNQLKEGIYFVKLENENEIIVRKIIIKH
jgi:hypothetical protein